MACKSCGAEVQSQFRSEIAIHSRDKDNTLVFVFPDIFVCLNCGKLEFAGEFTVPEDELRLLTKRDAAAAG